MAETTRLVLQCGPAPAGRLGMAFGATLPTRLLTANAAGPRAALRLGPDEWLLLAEDTPAAVLVPLLEAARGGEPASIVDVSDRQVAIELTGPATLELLAEGCPLDLAAMPVNGCTRTLFGKVEIVLWRQGPEQWRLEVARSYAAHLREHLAEAGSIG